MTKSEREAELFAFFASEKSTLEALHNWGSWAKDRKISRTCFSLEGRYRSAPNDDDRQPVMQVDVKRALIVAKAIAPPDSPVKAAFALSAWFIAGARDNSFCKYMREHGHPLPVRDIESTMRDSVLVARNRIRAYNPPTI